MYKNLSDRLVYALEQTGTRKAELARAINVKPQVIQFLCNSSTTSSRFTFEIASALGVSPKWLATGEGAVFISKDPSYKLLNKYSPIPILSNEAILKNLSDLSSISNLDQYDWAASDLGEGNIYCIIMKDTSMEPKLPYSAKLFFQYEQDYFPKDNDIVVACIPSVKAILIRQCIITNSKCILQPINESLYKAVTLTQGINIIGVVKQCQWSIGSEYDERHY